MAAATAATAATAQGRVSLAYSTGSRILLRVSQPKITLRFKLQDARPRAKGKKKEYADTEDQQAKDTGEDVMTVSGVTGSATLLSRDRDDGNLTSRPQVRERILRT